MIYINIRKKPTKSIYLFFNKFKIQNFNVIHIKAEFNKFIRKLFVLVCLLGFIYQMIELMIQYSNKETIVNIKIQRIQYSRLPAITLCYPLFFSRDKLTVNNETSYFNLYQNLYDKIPVYSMIVNYSVNNDHNNKIHVKVISFDLNGKLLNLRNHFPVTSVRIRSLGLYII